MKNFKAKPSTSYKRYTPVQLSATVRKLQKYGASISKAPADKKYRGKTAKQQYLAIAREARKVALILRKKIELQINEKIHYLNSQFAKNLGVKPSSSKVAKNAAVRRLKAKLKQLKKITKISQLITFNSKLKLSSFKNPVHKAARKVTRKVNRAGTKAKGFTRKAKIKTKRFARKAKGIAKGFKKEVKKLKNHNSFMPKLVNKIRRKVAKFTNSYKAKSAQPRWKVIKGSGKSNVVRLHHHRRRASHWNRPAQKRA